MSNYYLVKLYFNINDYISEQTDTVIAITDSLEKAKDIISEYYVDNFTEAEKSKVEFTINERTNDMEFAFEEDSSTHIFSIKEIELNEIIK